MLMQEDSFKAMKLVHSALPDDQVSEAWQATAKAEMLQSNHLKYSACMHARDKLLKSKLVLAEATGDPFWGMGLGVAQMWECLSDYLPGKNVMETVLMEI